MLISVQPQCSLLELKRPPKTVGSSEWSNTMKKKKIVSKKEVNMEEITQKLIKLRDELDDYYNNVFIPEYRDKKVFGRVVPKKFSRKTGTLNENKRYWRKSLRINSVGGQPWFKGLLEVEKQILISISQLNDDELDGFIESMDSDEQNN